MHEEVRKFMKANASRGGKARASKLTPERRREIAQKAAQARYAKKKAAQ
jgi:glutathione synthase/RimK-type ligase-like ATP-grasp enzyme